MGEAWKSMDGDSLALHPPNRYHRTMPRRDAGTYRRRPTAVDHKYLRQAAVVLSLACLGHLPLVTNVFPPRHA